MSASFVTFCFSVSFVSLAVTKAIHLYIHASTISPGAFLLFLPSLLFPDVLVICLSRLALQGGRKGAIAMAACMLACVFSAVLLAGAASQISFFSETGSEVEWSLVLGYVGESDGLKILLSGLSATFIAGGIIIVTAWFAKWYLYRIVGALLFCITSPIVSAWQSWRHSSKRHNSSNPTSYNSNSDSSDEYDLKEDDSLILGDGKQRKSSRLALPIVAGSLVFVALTTLCRPAAPYTMMSATLPSSMLDMFKSKPDMCTEQAELSGNKFPFPDLIDKTKWRQPTAYTKAWAPGRNDFVRKYQETAPSWLPKEINAGFQKWLPKEPSNDTLVADPSACGIETGGTFYNPVSDPLKITNLDHDIMATVKEALGSGNVKIKHVALVLMESYREELFPLQQGSDIHKIVMKSYEHTEEKEDDINARLAGLCPIAEKITGKPGNFKRKDGSAIDPPATPEWNDTTREGFGGINVVGAFTSASISFKSMAAIMCGAWPMPVDKFEESETQSYQPCIPQVLDLFNSVKKNNVKDPLEQQWEPAFFQSITDGYDRQRKFLEKIGFDQIITKSRLDKDASKAGEKLEEINYFGYAETVMREHVKNYLQQVKDQGKRMFLSHFTSTSHHPWGVPDDFNTTKYLHADGKMRWHKDFDKYFNSIRFTDKWLGEFLQMLDDFGMSDETLVVFVGDHGQAFKEDSSKTGTYENGHVSNFRVPITFRHPNLPRVQYNANATSVSILPTILDLLINTNSLNPKDTKIASDLVQDYEGQSLIRPYKANDEGRRAWNFGIINGGGSMLSLTSADAPWRLVMPLDEKSEFRFTDLNNDRLELNPVEEWSHPAIVDRVKSKFGPEAAQWVLEAKQMGHWWGLERKRLWGYSS